MGVDGIVLVDLKQLKSKLKSYDYSAFQPLFLIDRFNGLRWYNYPDEMRNGEFIKLYNTHSFKKLLKHFFKKILTYEDNETPVSEINFMIQLIATDFKEDYSEKITEKTIDLFVDYLVDNLVWIDDENYVRMVIVPDDATDVIATFKKEGFVELDALWTLLYSKLKTIKSRKQIEEEYYNA